MTTPQKFDLSASAAWTAYLRALASSHPRSRLHDPYAALLAGTVFQSAEHGDPEGKPASEVNTKPNGRHQHLGNPSNPDRPSNTLIPFPVEATRDLHRATAAIATRTLVFDELLLDLIQSSSITTVLNLGAGYDTRPFRLPLPSSCCWIEVDQSEVLARKQDVLETLSPQCHLRQLSYNITRADHREQLFREVAQSHGAPHTSDMPVHPLHPPGEAVLVITEGVLAYLEETQVADLACDLARHLPSAWWITDLGSPYYLSLIQTQAHARTRQSSQPYWWDRCSRKNVLAPRRPSDGLGVLPDEPSSYIEHLHFAPASGTGFFAACGWEEITYRSYLEEGRRLGYTKLLPWLAARFLFRVANATQRQALQRLVGAVLLRQR